MEEAVTGTPITLRRQPPLQRAHLYTATEAEVLAISTARHGKVRVVGALHRGPRIVCDTLIDMKHFDGRIQRDAKAPCGPPSRRVSTSTFAQELHALADVTKPTLG